MAKTETYNAPAVTRSWLPPLDGGTAIMAGLIGFMGFYVLYPLILIVINSFNTATIAEPEVYGLKAWREAFSEPGIWRSLWNSVKIGIVLQIDCPAHGHFHFLVAGAHQYSFSERAGVRLLDFIFHAQPGDDFWLDVDARSEHGPDQFLAAPDAAFERSQFRHLFVLGHRLGPSGRQRDFDQSHVDDAGVSPHGRVDGRSEPDVRRKLADDSCCASPCRR